MGAEKRPKIGVALSGGGARGLAHIGVLEWFEQHRIPIDYLAGTSMGGLIGGLYCMGIDPKQLRQIVQEMNWDQLLSAAPAYTDLSFRRKEDRDLYPSPVELGWRKGLQVQSGLSDAHSIGLLLSRLTLPYSLVPHFDELPTPFRAVAADMVTGERVVLEDGSLAQALQATMAIPGVFPPVEIGGKFLADGGLLNNLPTDVVKTMGADVVIAVDVGTPLKGRESLSSFVGVLEQSIGIMMIESIRQNLLLADIILSPNLENFTPSDFKAGKTLADLGYQAAQDKAVVLEGLAATPAQWSTHVDGRRSRERQAGLTASFVEVSGPSRRAEQEITQRLEKHSTGDLQTALLETDLNSIYGLGRYRSLTYRGILRDLQEGLLVETRPKAHGPPFIHLGLEVNGAEMDNIRFGVRSRITFFDAGGYGSEWRVDLGVGSRLFAASEYYRPVGGGFFIAPRAFAQREITDLFQEGDRTSEYRSTSAGVGLDLGYGFGSRTDEIRLGYQLSHIDASVRIGDPLLPSLEGTISAASLGWIHEGLDSSMVPRSGLRVELRPSWFFQSPGISGGFPQARLRVSFFKKIGTPNSLFLIGEGGTTFNETAPPAQQLTLGGPFRLGAFGQDEFRGSRLVFSGQGYLHQIGSLSGFWGGKIYAAGWHEIGSVFERAGPRDYLSVLSGGILAETLVGPMFLGGSWGEGGRGKLYFSVGSLF